MLDILIPTFNRCEFLLKNLRLLSDAIIQGNYQDAITIIISDNKSTDDTSTALADFMAGAKISIKLHTQTENIGLKDNAIFVLAQATQNYVMYIGDDDFISFSYLKECMDILQNDKLVSAIIPNFYNISVNEEQLSEPRETEKETIFFEKGFDSLYQNSWKGHQLSGLVFKRASLLADYKKLKISNIYLFIFFTCASILKGRTYLVTKNPVRVTKPVKAKDWGYGQDGLLNEVFDNFIKLPIGYLDRTRLQIKFFKVQIWRLLRYQSKGKAQFVKSFFSIWTMNNSTVAFKAVFPFLVFGHWFSKKIGK